MEVRSYVVASEAGLGSMHGAMSYRSTGQFRGHAIQSSRSSTADSQARRKLVQPNAAEMLTYQNVGHTSSKNVMTAV